MRISVMALAMLVLAGAAQQQADPKESKPVDPMAMQLHFAQTLLEQAQMESDKARSELQALRASIRDQTGWIEVNSEAMRKAAENLQAQQERLELEDAAAVGRRKGLEDAIARASHDIKEVALSDTVAGELQKVVDVRQTELKRYLATKSAVSEATIQTAEANLAQAKADLAMARQRATTGAAENLNTWNRELLNLSVQESERQSKSKFIAERLQKLASVIDRLDDLDRLREQEHRAQSTVQSAQNHVRQIQEQIESIRAASGSKQ